MLVASVTRLSNFKNSNIEFQSLIEYILSVLENMTKMYSNIDDEIKQVYKFSTNIEKVEQRLSESLASINEKLNFFR